MIFLKRIGLSIIILALCLGAAVAEGQKSTNKTGGHERELAGSINRFGFNLFSEITKNNDDNVFISPLSVSYALAMTLNGADNETRDAILKTLELNDIAPDKINPSYKNLTEILSGLDESVTFEIANSIWYRNGLPVSREFVDTNKVNFDALVRGLDFGSPSSADIINKWVSDNTSNKIEKIISPPIDPSTIMFLINAIYFKGSWAVKFDPVKTRDHPFFFSEDNSRNCKMMFNTDKFDYFDNDLFQAISLPYGKNGFSMMVFLPRPDVTVEDVGNRLDEQNWAIWQKSFYNTEVELGLPKFKLEYDINMNDALKAMGMAIAFDGSKADFRKMLKPGAIPDRNVFIDRVKHKTFVQVDEEGTEAAAVTSITMALTSSVSMPPPKMIVERPFLFAIYEKSTGAIAFIGKITDPVWEE